MRLFKASDFTTDKLTHDEIFARDHGKAKLEALKMARKFKEQGATMTEDEILRDVHKMKIVERNATKEKLQKYVYGGTLKH